MVNIKTVEDLANAIKQNESEIIVDGDIAKKIETIKATGTSSWLTALGFISFSAFSLLLSEQAAATGKKNTRSPTHALMESPGAKIAIDILGAATTATAISLAIAAHGIGVLFDLRLKYDIVESSSDKLTLRLI